MLALEIVIALAPVFVFLAALILCDSFKLAGWRMVLTAILAGFAAAAVSYEVTAWVIDGHIVKTAHHTRFSAPVVEELLKALFLLYLIRASRIGFLVDSAIYGFAIGAGFASVENLYYLYAVERGSLVIWVIRGFGTAIMHGGTTAIFGILSKGLVDRHDSHKLVLFVPGLLVAAGIHSVYNHFILPPALGTVVLVITLPLLLVFIFERSEAALRSWLELDLDADMAILDYIRSGRVLQSRMGRYLRSLKGRFPGEVLADMLCYVRLHVELAIRAKGILMMREAGFKPDLASDILEKFEELAYLARTIGKTGRLAVSPLLRTRSRDLWQLKMLLDL
ncbi:MAG: PrsW family glutamic-type intramembrane protease [Acidobacteriota bacterium]